MNPLIRYGVLAAVVSVIGFEICYAVLPQQDAKPKAKATQKPTLMQKKLVQAQKILEGLAIQDFAKISAAADELADIRKEAAWMVVKTPDYEMFSVAFSRNIDAAKRAAKNKNTDAAALAYVEMTFSCVNCHKYVRDSGIALNRAAAVDAVGE